MEAGGKPSMAQSGRRGVAFALVGVVALLGLACFFSNDAGKGKATVGLHEPTQARLTSNAAANMRRLVKEKEDAEEESDEEDTEEEETDDEDADKEDDADADKEDDADAEKEDDADADKEDDADKEEDADADEAPAEEPAIKCPACAPKKKNVPDVVIPFFERDLCKLKVTVKSIVKNDPGHNLGNIFLMWVSTKPHTDYEADLEEAILSVGSDRKVHLIDFSPQVLDSKFSGWFAQQVLKLKIASLVTSEYYLVMDSKNTIITDVKPDMFFTPCNQAKLFTQFHFKGIPDPHCQWYAAAAHELGITSPGTMQDYWPASITPMVFHTATVLDLLAKIGEDPQVDTICSGPLCTIFGVYLTKPQDQNHGTEFTMFIMYAYSSKHLECTYAIEQKDEDDPNQMALSLWRGVKENMAETMKNDVETVVNITKGILKPVMFGSQPSALDEMSSGDRQKALKHLQMIYEKAHLFDPDTDKIEDLIDCVIGKY